jgi:hypothetical protein
MLHQCPDLCIHPRLASMSAQLIRRGVGGLCFGVTVSRSRIEMKCTSDAGGMEQLGWR